MTCLWSDGVYLGVKGSTGEIIVGNRDGVWKTRTVQRRPKEERWKVESVNEVSGVPWRMNERDPNADGEAMGGKVIDLLDGRALEKKEEEEVRERAKLHLPRSFRTSEEDYQMHGYTRQCSGCKALLGGTAIQKHSDLCRKLIAEALVGQRRVEEARERKRRFVEEALEEEEKIWESKEMSKKAKKGKVDDEKVANVAEGAKRGIEDGTQEEMATKKMRPETVNVETEKLMEIGELAVNQEDEFDGRSTTSQVRS